MTILVTGTSGHLGRLVVETLLDQGIDPTTVVAVARDTAAIADLAERGVQVRRADYDDPASLDAAFAGVDKALLVSSSAVGARVGQHRNVIDAAAKAGVSLLAYTSVVRAEVSVMELAADHRETEALLRVSGVPHVILRNGWYLENYTGQIATALTHGVILGAAGAGRVSAAARADYAAAAAAVLVLDGQAGKVYELGGDEAFSLDGFAAELAEQGGTAVAYRDLSTEDYAAALVTAGLPEGYAAILADSDHGIADGALYVDSGELGRLIGRPTTTLREAIKSAMADVPR
ncbi:MAG TPA: SDR family oxidoreductase [Actinokineospora sp.]|nr:SDR family oxidoreductase [Actinokineospora sp.]